MSNVNIMRAVENIRAQTNVFTPVVEAIVNAIDAIEETERSAGLVAVTVHRSARAELDSGPAALIGFAVEDNGVGFTPEHRQSFDTLYTTRQLHQGGKGFGRFTWLKYFDDVQIESVFAALATGMTDGMEMSYQLLDSLLAE